MASSPTVDPNGTRGTTHGGSAADELRTPLERTESLAHALRRRWKPAMAILLLTCATGLFLTLHASKKYEATAQILLQPTDAVSAAVTPDTVPSSANAQRDVDTNARLITVKPVAEAVRRQLGLQMSAGALVERIGISGQADSNLVSITATDTSPVRAARIATAFAVSYREYRRRTAQQAIDQALVAGRKALAARRRDHASREARGAVARRLRELEVASATQTGGVQIVRRAQVPTEASSRRGVGIVGTLLAGLLLALLTALALNRFDRRLREPSDIETALGVPVLGVLPAATARSADARADACADLVAQLELEAGPRGSVLMVVSCGRRVAAGEVAVNVASQFAEMGQRVLLIEADLRRDSSGEPPPAGLTTLLAGEGTLSGLTGELHIVTQATGNGRPRAESLLSYSCLSSGPPVRNPGALLGRPALGQLLTQAAVPFDLVVVDSGAVLPVSDTAPVARLCDMILLVAERGRTTQDDVEQARRAIGSHYRKVVGVAVQTARRRTQRAVPPRVEAVDALQEAKPHAGDGDAARLATKWQAASRP